MEEQLVFLILLFFTLSFGGWCMEVILKYRQYHRFINRGFLTGPWLPIYGSGAVMITVGVGALSKVDAGIGTTFALSFVICGFWEYFISWYLEKKFHARWWDYSQKPMNLNGRVWIGNLILFGLGGVLIYHFIDPALWKLFAHLTLRTKEIIAAVLLALFAADEVLSHFVMKLVKRSTEESEADNTEEISKEIRLLLSNRSYFYRRFADAYPEVIYRTEKITARLEAVKAETERMKKEAELRVEELKLRVDEGKAQLAEALEPTEAIKTTVIAKQSELIELLYNEANVPASAKNMKEEIDAQMERIRRRRSLLKRDVE